MKGIEFNIDTMLLEEREIPVQYFYNDKIILLTKPKLAHSWCRTNFLPKNNTKEYSDKFNTGLKINYTSLAITSSQSISQFNEDSILYHKSCKESWNAVLDRKSKKDIIIVYRNPILAWMSGMYQDTYGKNLPCERIKDSKFIHYIMNLHDASKEEKEQYIHECKYSISFFELTKSFPIIGKAVLYYFIEEFMISDRFNQGHSESWIPFVYKLLNTKELDTAKIRLVDIYDDPLELQLKNYFEPGHFSTYDGLNYKRDHTQFQDMYNVLVKSKYVNFIKALFKDEYNMYLDIKENYKKYHIHYE